MFANDERSRLEFVRKYLQKSLCPEAIISMIVNCLSAKPESRMSFQELAKLFQNEIFIHSAIRVPDSSSMRFWRKYFLVDHRHEVSFDELLAAMTNEALVRFVCGFEKLMCCSV